MGGGRKCVEPSARWAAAANTSEPSAGLNPRAARQDGASRAEAMKKGLRGPCLSSWTGISWGFFVLNIPADHV